MKPQKKLCICVVALSFLLAQSETFAQVNSGSDGSDGALNPTDDLVIDMADHPDGVYQYTEVNIPSGVTVSFVSNAANTPVIWLVQGNVTVEGSVSVSGEISNTQNGKGGYGGPGGYTGGNASPVSGLPGAGNGPGGGKVDSAELSRVGSNASYASSGADDANPTRHHPSGDLYGNMFLVP